MRLLVLLLLVCQSAIAQELRFQHGVGFSLYFGNEFKYLLSYNPNLAYPVPTAGSQAVIPMLDAKISVYNNNLGSSVLPAFRNRLHVNLAFSPVVSYSFTKASVHNPGYIPIFSSTFFGMANTDYDNNIGLSTIYVWQLGFGKVRSLPRSQRIGQLFISTKWAYFFYYNDGGPVNKWFGDKEDRYWTGGGGLGIKYTHQHEVQHIALNFDKYSGFIKHAFEASGLLYADNVMYRNPVETSYNSSKYSIRYLHPSQYFGASINWWNTPFDFQDFIHRNISSDPYHFKLRKKHVDFEIIGLYEN